MAVGGLDLAAAAAVAAVVVAVAVVVAEMELTRIESRVLSGAVMNRLKRLRPMRLRIRIHLRSYIGL